MALKQPVLAEDDPRRETQATTYQSSRGGWFPIPEPSEREPEPRPSH